jgi:hypothetical protein
VTLQRGESPDQDGAANPLRFADGVEKMMDAVGEVDVGEPRAAEHRAVAHRRAVVGVACRVLRSVGFGLHDHAGGQTFGGIVGEDTAQEIDRDVARIPIVKIGP